MEAYTKLDLNIISQKAVSAHRESINLIISIFQKVSTSWDCAFNLLYNMVPLSHRKILHGR